MEKVLLKGTYGFKNFIKSEIQTELVNWTNDNIDKFRINPNGYGRKNKFITSEDSIHPIVQEIKKRVIEVDGMNPSQVDFSHMDYIGVNIENAYIHKHIDHNKGDLTHVRWNLILGKPEDGGHSIYGKEINILEEKMIWKCIAGKVLHGSTPVIGKKPRITLSLGFFL